MTNDQTSTADRGMITSSRRGPCSRRAGALGSTSSVVSAAIGLDTSETAAGSGAEGGAGRTRSGIRYERDGSEGRNEMGSGSRTSPPRTGSGGGAVDTRGGVWISGLVSTTARSSGSTGGVASGPGSSSGAGTIRAVLQRGQATVAPTRAREELSNRLH